MGSSKLKGFLFDGLTFRGGKGYAHKVVDEDVAIRDELVEPYTKTVSSCHMINASLSMLKASLDQDRGDGIVLKEVYGNFISPIKVGDCLEVKADIGLSRSDCGSIWSSEFEGLVGKEQKFHITIDHILGSGVDVEIVSNGDLKLESFCQREQIMRILKRKSSELEEILYCEACSQYGFVAQGTKTLRDTDFILDSFGKSAVNPAGFMEAIEELGSFVFRKELEQDATFIIDGGFRVRMCNFDYQLLERGMVYLTIHSCLPMRSQRAIGRVFASDNQIMQFEFNYDTIPVCETVNEGMLVS